MSKRGWSLNSLQYPDSIHLCCTVRTCGPKVEGEFIADLKECVAEAKARADANPEEVTIEEPGRAKTAPSLCFGSRPRPGPVPAAFSLDTNVPTSFSLHTH